MCDLREIRGIREIPEEQAARLRGGAVRRFSAGQQNARAKLGTGAVWVTVGFFEV